MSALGQSQEYIYVYFYFWFKWAPSSEFVSSSIPSWQISTAHAQPFRGARDLAFCLKVPLDSLFVWASSEGSGETARMRRLAWTFAARIGDKQQIRLACWSGYSLCLILFKSYILGEKLGVSDFHYNGTCRLCNSILAAWWQNQQNGMFAQWRLRSAWASAQSDQNLRCPYEESMGP